MSRNDRAERRRRARAQTKSVLLAGDAPGGNYLDIEKILGLPLRVGAVMFVDVLHDDWCALLTKGLPCNCDPEVHSR